MIDPYEVLGVASDADFETIRAAYRRLVRDNHPDVALDKAAATQRMAQINQAWQLVGTPDKRAAHDARVKLQGSEHEALLSEDRIRLENQRRVRLEREKMAMARLQRPRSTRVKKSKDKSKKTSSRVTVDRKTENSKRNSKSKNPARDMRLLQKMALATQLFHREGRFEEAARLCRDVLLADGRNVPARELIADILAAQGRFESALIMFDQAIQIAPHDRMLRRKRDRLQMQQTRQMQSHPHVSRVPTRKPRLSLLGRLRARFSK